MSKRLFMTSADYVAIAISPAFIMALVGSLVFFLIEVLYVGEYQARLNYAFALFVFATVLIARISIEEGAERAAVLSLPLAVVMFLFLLRFVEHPSAYSALINLALMAVVWCCAHKLTWDSTVIDDDEDASGEGLMQRIGVDGPPEQESSAANANAAQRGDSANELFDSADRRDGAKNSWWQRWTAEARRSHAPGVWVFYFSLAALPLFGIGQGWIPVADVGRRRYAFVLLVVYVAAALSLLVTTSFLNLRRYLRQRRIEMPLSIVGNWVGTGVVVILLVLFVAILIPRPSAEVALSRVPWQAGSPSDLTASRRSVMTDGGEAPTDRQSATTGETVAEEGQPGDQPGNGKAPPGESGPESQTTGGTGESQSGKSSSGDSTQSGDESRGESRDAKAGVDGSPGESGNSDQSEAGDSSSDSQATNAPPMDETNQEAKNAEEPDEPRQGEEQIQQSTSKQPLAPPWHSLPRVGGVGSLLKVLFYLVLAAAAVYLAVRYWQQIMQTLADLWRKLLALFGGKSAVDIAANDAHQARAVRPPSFTEFRDPFAGGQHGKMQPEDLVRYTFAALEAWASDRGLPRTPDCTPQELIVKAVAPETPMYTEARRLLRQYSQVAYASQRIPREATNELRTLWQIMRATHVRQESLPAN